MFFKKSVYKNAFDYNCCSILSILCIRHLGPNLNSMMISNLENNKTIAMIVNNHPSPILVIAVPMNETLIPPKRHLILYAYINKKKDT